MYGFVGLLRKLCDSGLRSPELVANQTQIRSMEEIWQKLGTPHTVIVEVKATLSGARFPPSQLRTHIIHGHGLLTRALGNPRLLVAQMLRRKEKRKNTARTLPLAQTHG